MKISLEFFKDIEDYAIDKGLDPKDTIKIFESSISEVIELYYSVKNFHTEISKTHNMVKMFENLKIVAEVRDPKKEISLKDALEIKDNVKIGETLKNEVFFPDLERTFIKKIKETFTKKINSIERELQYEEFKDKVGVVGNYLIKGIEFGNIILDIGIGEGLLKKEDLIPGEIFQINGRVKAIIYQVFRRETGFQVVLSRTSNEFLTFLLKDYIPEISEGAIEIKAAARIPGKKSKIAVISTDFRTDAIATCVGIKGVRINSVVKELNGERIDVVAWSPDIATFIVNAMSPAEVSKIIMDSNKVTVVVPESQLNFAIGSGGANIKLASRLTKFTIKVLSESQHSENRNQEVLQIVNRFTSALSIDEIMARFLAMEGISGFYDIIDMSAEDLASLEGFDENIAIELQKRAISHLNSMCDELKISNDLRDFFENKEMLIQLAEKDPSIKSLEDFANFSRDELIEIINYPEFTEQKADDMILNARKILGWLNE